MNLTNPHQTIRTEDRRDLTNISRTGYASKLVAMGTGLGKVLRLSKKFKPMPDLSTGSGQGAQDVVQGYLVDALEQVFDLGKMLGQEKPITDERLNNIALACEVTAIQIQRYLAVKEAGRSHIAEGGGQ